MLWFSSTERFGRTVRIHADVAQLVEHHLAKVRVAGSSPVIRSEEPGAPSPSISWWVGREVRHRPAKPFTPVRIRYPPRAIGAAGARFPDTEEVTGSIPVSPTRTDSRSEPGAQCSGLLSFFGKAASRRVACVTVRPRCRRRGADYRAESRWIEGVGRRRSGTVPCLDRDVPGAVGNGASRRALPSGEELAPAARNGWL